MRTHLMMNQMQALGLAGIASTYRELTDQPGSDWLGRDEWLGLMLDRDVAMRKDVSNEPAEIIALFVRRRQIEVTFAEP